jgi:hypothetical protein
MEYSSDTTLVFGGDASLDHVVSHPFQLGVEEVLELMQSSFHTTLLLESGRSSKVVKLVRYLADPTLLSGSDAYSDYVFSISSLVHFEQVGIPLS